MYMMDLLRISVGIEDIEDIKEDFDQAFKKPLKKVVRMFEITNQEAKDGYIDYRRGTAGCLAAITIGENSDLKSDNCRKGKYKKKRVFSGRGKCLKCLYSKGADS